MNVSMNEEEYLKSLTFSEVKTDSFHTSKDEVQQMVRYSYNISLTIQDS